MSGYVDTAPRHSSISCIIDKDGDCQLDGMDAFHLLVTEEPGLVSELNARIIAIMGDIRANSTKTLELNADFLSEKLDGLRIIGVTALQLLGEFFRSYWEDFQDQSDLNLVMHSSSFSLLWEYLYFGPSDGPVDISRFLGARHRIVRRMVETKPVWQNDSLASFLFNMNRDLKYAVEEKSILDSLCQEHLLFETLEEAIDRQPEPLQQKEFWRRVIYAWTGDEYDIIHLACHLYPQANSLQSYLKITVDEEHVKLPLENLLAASRDNRFHCKPLVFLNACKTVDSAQLLKYTGFPRTLMRMGASAVLCTTCDIPDLFAKEFARVFYEKLFTLDLIHRRSPTLGEALLAARRYFLETYNNPLGFAYVLYSHDDDLSMNWEVL